jgi:phosphoglycerate kinase
MKSVKSTDIKNKKVFLRVDFNIDLDEKGNILSDFRIKAVIPTIQFLLSAGVGKIIIASHLGKPKGKDEKLSLKSIAEYLGKLLNQPVVFVDDCIGEKVKLEIEKSPLQSIIVLENLRFYEGEENNNIDFAKELANLADIFVNDAFGVCHRENASIVAITNFLPSYAGLLLEKEIENLDKINNNFEKPLVLILGGAKISTKLPLINKFLDKADKVLLGGGLVNTILKANGKEIGQSIFESELLKEAQVLNAENIIMPNDFLIGKSLDDNQARAVLAGNVNINDWILDIGPETLNNFVKIISNAKTIVWNGPVGYSENPVFRQGTNKIIEAIVNSQAFSVVGGGETLLALEQAKVLEKISFVSTGGGAMLSYLSGEEMLGLKYLN